MAKKEFTYRGKKVEDLEKLSLNELAELFPSRQRRKIKRGFTEQEKLFLKKVRNGESKLKTHCREMIVLPEMVDKTIEIHNGKEFVKITIQPEMIGHFFGEFTYNRKRVAHSSPGIGATRSSAAMSVK